MEPREPSDRNALEALDPEGTSVDEIPEAGHRHLIEPPRDFTEPGGAVGFEIRAPSDERRFGEDQVRPGKEGEQVAAVRM